MRKIGLVIGIVVIIALAGCVGTGPDTQQDNSQNEDLETPEESRTTQTDIDVTEEGDRITYTLTSLDDRTDRVVVRKSGDILYTFDEVGDSYTMNTSERHAVIAFQNDKEILLERNL